MGFHPRNLDLLSS